MKKNPKIIVSFDVEEFDLPLEFGQRINTAEQLETGYNGMVKLLSVLDTDYCKATLFTTAFFAASYPELMRRLAVKHEIASHTYYHSSFELKDLSLSRLKLEEITGTKITGLRMPRMKRVPAEEVKLAGYAYNSSVNPTWLPGRYNNLNHPRVPFLSNGIIEVPVSVTPHFRIPLFWLAFKNFPYRFYLRLAKQTLRHDGHLLLYFHPWEFTDLSAYKLPGYIKRGSNEVLLARLQHLITALSHEGEFCTLQEFLNEMKRY